MASSTSIQNNHSLEKEVARRRTFAIISHPDAGKTTLTEKLLLYSGAIAQAGAVRSRKNQRSAVSDWMEMEQERGISITSTALQFEHRDHLLNLLDTPGHKDFSEDTYRTLMAVDSAIMVLDASKGIESQTKKLFEVCRSQNLPILTFINKLDLPARDPLSLLDEIEDVLSMRVAPMNWPIGDGRNFQGVFDLHQQQVLFFERADHGKNRAAVSIKDLDDEQLDNLLGSQAAGRLRETIELIQIAGHPYSPEDFMAGTLTPLYFGSALNNFGIETFLDALVDLAPPPQARTSSVGLIEPTNSEFTGFVFKIQANMDPRHRDRMAFIRICSGRFERDMTVHHSRRDDTIRMSRPHRLFAKGRDTVEEGYPGDVLGLSNPGIFSIGDTVSSDSVLEYAPIPPFQPEHFALLRNQQIDRYKQFNKGVDQLAEEGVIQILHSIDPMRREPVLAAVGELQFDVVLARLEAEYGVEATIQRMEHSCARWIVGTPEQMEQVRWPSSSFPARDRSGNLVVLFPSVWQMEHVAQSNKDLKFLEVGDLVAQSSELVQPQI